jgi:DNA-binding response OmpR family regulator
MRPSDVLVVEDDPDINEMIGAYLELEGFACRRFLDGTTALREARRQPPALVVLDLMLPDVNGMEVCRRLRADEATRDVRVVIVTALDDAATREEARGCGVLGYMTKPFDPDALLDVVRENVPASGGSGCGR